MKKVLLYIEDEFCDESLGLLEVSRKLYPSDEIKTYAIAINQKKHSCINGLCDVIFSLNDEDIKTYDQKAISDILSNLQSQFSFDAILFLATHMGRCIAPSLAMKLNTGIVADVTAISNENGEISLIRPAYSGKIMAGINIVGQGPIMMSVRSGIFSFEDYKKVDTKLIELKNIAHRLGNIKIKNIENKKIPYDIRKSDVLVSGGAGCTDLENLNGLAKLLNAHVSASRAVVDKGLVSRAIQVGQSGKTVSPSLYMAFGIHGALQHVEGLKDILNIISINTNKNAPICSISDIVVEGDAVLFLKKLIKRIEKGYQNDC